MLDKIILASNNAGKINEFQRMFATLKIDIVPQEAYHVPEVDEPYHTFLENALHKARHAAKYTNLPTLADDSGLCVPALNGAPGIYSARYAGQPKDDIKNNNKLISALTNSADKRAYYYCVLVLVRHEHDPQPLIADGYLHGQIVDIAAGNNGFGYDPHFYLPEYKQTAAELDTEIKTQISHRRTALNKLLTQFKEVTYAT